MVYYPLLVIKRGMMFRQEIALTMRIDLEEVQLIVYSRRDILMERYIRRLLPMRMRQPIVLKVQM